MSFGSSKGAGPSGNVPDVLYSGVTSSPFGQPGDLFGSMTPGSQTPYGGLEQQPVTPNTFAPGQGPYGGLEGGGMTSSIPSSPSTPSAPDFSSQLAQFSVPSMGGSTAGLTASTDSGPTSGNWNSGIGSEFGEVDNPAYGGYTEPNWNKGAWGDQISGWTTKGVALPNVPRGTVVEVMSPQTGKTDYATVIDKGPGAQTGAIIDLAGGTRAALGLDRNFKGPIQYRIVGGPGTQIPQVAAQPSQVEPSQALTQAQPQSQQQPKKQQPAAQKKRRKPPQKMIAGITPSFKSPPAELDFLRQALAGLPYNPTQQQEEEDQTA